MEIDMIKERKENGEVRFFIINKATGEVIADANGHGYKTEESAMAYWNSTHKDNPSKSERNVKDMAQKAKLDFPDLEVIQFVNRDGNERYALRSISTGRIVDASSSGYGYLSPDKAFASWYHKQEKKAEGKEATMADKIFVRIVPAGAESIQRNVSFAFDLNNDFLRSVVNKDKILDIVGLRELLDPKQVDIVFDTVPGDGVVFAQQQRRETVQ